MNMLQKNELKLKYLLLMQLAFFILFVDTIAIEKLGLVALFCFYYGSEEMTKKNFQSY